MGADSHDLDAPLDADRAGRPPRPSTHRTPDTDADAHAESDIEFADTDAAPQAFDLGDGDITTRVAHARQRHGRTGAMLAAGMLGLDQVVNGRKPREDAPIVIAANSDPIDVDRDGISVPLDPDDPDGQFAVAAPPLPRRAPIVSPSGSGRRRWR